VPGLLLGVAGLALAWGPARAAADVVPADLPAAVARLGAPGLLWGRLVAEEESPDGPRTPLADVEVTVYVATQNLVDELERIRREARDSWAQYEQAVARIQAALVRHQAQVDALDVPVLRAAAPVGAEPSAPPPVPGRAARTLPPSVQAPAPPLRVIRQRTDPAGLFVFETLPAGHWLVVAVRTVPYGEGRLRQEPKPRPGARGQRYLPRGARPTRQAEIWLVRVEVLPGGRQALELSERSRWLDGPAP
jgi:hypothetical protein